MRGCATSIPSCRIPDRHGGAHLRRTDVKISILHAVVGPIPGILDDDLELTCARGLDEAQRPGVSLALIVSLTDVGLRGSLCGFPTRCCRTPDSIVLRRLNRRADPFRVFALRTLGIMVSVIGSACMFTTLLRRWAATAIAAGSRSDPMNSLLVRRQASPVVPLPQGRLRQGGRGIPR